MDYSQLLDSTDLSELLEENERTHSVLLMASKLVQFNSALGDLFMSIDDLGLDEDSEILDVLNKHLHVLAIAEGDMRSAFYEILKYVETDENIRYEIGRTFIVRNM